eukprot:CAMPEP_0201282274 /NCGR_PEP_ID=MMETSP1317-20130820/5212_1 /ASSEMBLY_ACC=CAM_ASM_000770 /TAXON_ID=187299 /ORGANISM="Undescribed Undescribed, Strain Undescribed" /LENGTH=67 /DNA_ID=CAMNT_0047594457 /DNA_START=2219 /DNA_END=2422 /DNA_ORIENTATION=-
MSLIYSLTSETLSTLGKGVAARIELETGIEEYYNLIDVKTEEDYELLKEIAGKVSKTIEEDEEEGIG